MKLLNKMKGINGRNWMNKKGDELIGSGIGSVILWIVFIIIAGGVIYFALRKYLG